MLLNSIISLLISYGYIQSEEQWNNLDQQQQQDLIEIIIDDDVLGL
jgi:hypothetical protein